MRRARKPTPSSSRRWIKITAWLAGILAVLTVIAVAGFKSWAMSYVRTPAFLRKVEEKASVDLRSRVEIQPVRFDGNEFFTDGIGGLGGPEAAFHAVKIDNVRGEFRLPTLWQVLFGKTAGIVDNITVQRFEADFDDLRTPMTLPPKEKHRHSQVINITVREVRIKWRSGGLGNLALRVSPREGGWALHGEGGTLNQLGLPAVEIVSIKALYKEPALFIQEAVLRHDGGEIVLSGEIRSKDKVDLLFNVKDMNVTPFLPDDWRARLHGRLHGEVRAIISTRDGDNSPPRVTGRLRLERGMLEAVPVLAKLAEFTKTEQFRRVPLNELSAEFSYDEKGIQVPKCALEGKQLISLRGSLSIVRDQVDGTFDLGITPGPLQWLPGSQDKVFTTLRDGYAWTPLRITGPTDAIKEDLSPRLIAAAEGAVVQKVTDTAKGVIENGIRKPVGNAVDGAVDTAKKAAEGALNLLLPK